MPGCLNHPEVDSGLRACTLCAESYCRDCLVDLAGAPYCAGCKATQLRSMRAGAPAPGELELATIGTRFLSQLVDGLVIGVPMMVVVFAIVLATVAGTGGKSPELAAGVQVWLQFAIMGLGLVYEGGMLAHRGQTVGKIVMRIKVVSPDGSEIRTQQAWLRALTRSGIGMLSCVALIDYLWALFTEERTCIHDLAGRTRVVQLPR